MPDTNKRYDFPTRGFLTKTERWMYPGGRPDRLARLLNRGWALAHATGLLPNRYVTLEVPGRRTGRILSFPLVMADFEGERYLVSMLGEDSNWVRNVRAAGGHAVPRHGRREAVRLEEVDPDARAPIVRRYLSLAPGPRAFITGRSRCPRRGVREDHAAYSCLSAYRPINQVKPMEGATGPSAPRPR